MIDLRELQRGRRPRSDSMATITKILAEAEREMADRGFHAARLSDIAARAGIGRSSILHHFESKQALYAAVMRTALRRVGEAVLIALDGADPLDQRLARAAEALEQFLDERPSVARLIVRELLGDGGPEKGELASSGAELLDRVEAALRHVGAGPALSAVPVRATLLQLAAHALLRAVARPSLRAVLWGGTQGSAALTTLLLAGEPRRLRALGP